MHFFYCRTILLIRSRKIYLAITRLKLQEDKFITHKNRTAARSSQEALMTSHCS